MNNISENILYIIFQVVGSPEQLLEAEKKICYFMKKLELKVKVPTAGRFRFQNLSVDGEEKPCNK